MDVIAASINRQFARMLGSLIDAMEKLDEAGTRAGDVDFLIPGRLAYHVLGSVDFYTEAAPNRAMINKLGGHWEKSPVAELPSKERLVEYAVALRGKIAAYLATVPDAVMLAPGTGFDWTGETVLERLVYALRHAQHHVGQINAELRRRGLPRGAWA